MFDACSDQLPILLDVSHCRVCNLRTLNNQDFKIVWYLRECRRNEVEYSCYFCQCWLEILGPGAPLSIELHVSLFVWVLSTHDKYRILFISGDLLNQDLSLSSETKGRIMGQRKTGAIVSPLAPVSRLLHDLLLGLRGWAFPVLTEPTSWLRIFKENCDNPDKTGTVGHSAYCMSHTLSSWYKWIMHPDDHTFPKKPNPICTQLDSHSMVGP